ncbi:MAG: hypothetical protein ABIJ97_11520 [Bacteroidota bacterium]
MTPNLMTGKIFGNEYDPTINKDNLIEELEKIKKLGPEIYHLQHGNIFKNEMAPKESPNDVLIFDFINTLFESKSSSFRGFLYPNGTVIGKMKHSYDAKLPDEHLKGFYTYDKKGVFIMYCLWNDSGFFFEMIP